MNGLGFPGRPKGDPLLSFPPFRLDLADERLWKDGGELRIRRKPFAILKHFVKHPRRLITHEEIVEAVWGKVLMSESLVRTHVRDLRQALGEGIIETVVGRGYRFLADVNHAEPDAPRASGPKAVSRADSIIGRAAELDVLDAALQGARARRRNIVFVTGDAGIGKTMLLDAFVESAGAQARLWSTSGTCIEQYGSGEAYLPVLEGLGNLCRGHGGERVVEVLMRHAPMWLAQMPALVAPDRLEELQRRIVGAAQSRMLREIAEALEALSADAPVVLTLDDLQWSDPSTMDLIAMLGRRREPAHLLVVGTYRPAEVAAGHPLTRVVDELVAHGQAVSVPLGAFDESSLSAYITRRFPGHRFPVQLGTTVLRSTGGNPLFVATLLEDLVSRGAIRTSEGGWELTTDVEHVAAQRPDSIRRLIDTQIDRLGTTEQRILEVASVSGLTFAAGVVAHALDAQVDEVDSCCETLANERRLLQYLGTETWPDGTIQSRYAFGHALIQHAALARNPSSSLRLWHRRIAERLEEGYAGREDQVAAELAVHFDEGHQFAKAAPHYLVAGERAAGRHGHVEAVVHFERSRHLVARLPEGRERDELELRVLHGLGPSLLATKAPTAHDLIATVERAVELATHLKDDVRRGAALVVLQRCRLWKGDFRAVGEHADEVMAAVERVPDPVLRASAAQLGGGAAFARGNFTEARRLLDLARAIDEADGAIPSEPLVAALSVGALLAWLTGRPDEALALAHDSVRSAEALREPSALTQALCGVATVRAWRGEPQQAEEPAQRALATATEEHMSFWRNRALSLVHWAKSELDPTTSAVHVDEQPSEPWDSRFAGRTLDALLFISLCARVGRETRALEEIASALAFADSNDERFLAPELHRLRGELLKASDKATAERSFTTAIDLAKKQSSTAFELRSTLSLHRIVGGARRRRIRDELRRLVSTYNEGLDTGDLRDARAVLAD